MMSSIEHNKNDLNGNQGITLTELIVASVMIGIVMLGVTSFGSSIKQFQGSTNKSVILSMKSKAAMARMSEDAFAAVGDSLDPGYVEDTSSGTNMSLCFRHDVNITPEIYTDDDWTCYYRDAQNILSLCRVPTLPANVPPLTDSECNGSGSRKELANLVDPVFYTVIFDTDNRLEYISLTINSRYDTSSAADPVNNPEYTVTTQVSPPGQSR